MNIKVLPFRIGRIAAEPLSNSEAERLEKAGKILFGRQASTGDLHYSIPLDDYSMRDPRYVARLLVEATGDFSTINALVIDIRSLNEGLIPDHHTISGILLGLEKVWNQKKDLNVVMLMEQLLMRDDVSIRTLEPYIEKGKLGIVDDLGNSLALPKMVFDRSAYADLALEIRTPPGLRLKKKLIRHVGHFPRYTGGKHSHCVPFYFDCSYAKEEISELVVEHLDQLAQSKGVNLLFDCNESTWLLESLEPLMFNDKLYVKDVREVLNHRSELEFPTILLVVPLVDSGATITSLIRRLEEAYPSTPIFALSILSSRSRVGSSMDEIVTAEGETITYSFFERVQRDKHEFGTCIACKSGLDFSDPGSGREYHQFTSQAMWKMMLESGLKDEDNVPRARDSLGKVPDFPKMINDNPQYIAYKFEKLFEAIPGYIPANPVIICPDEYGAEVLGDWLEELKESFENLFNFTLIKIPRQVLESTGPFMSGRNAAWEVALNSLAHRALQTPVILLDEFNSSGGTRVQLERVATSFGLEVVAYVCLADFDPRSGESSYPRLSLYDLQMDNKIFGPLQTRDSFDYEPPEQSVKYLLQLHFASGVDAPVPSKFRKLLKLDLLSKLELLPEAVQKDFLDQLLVFDKERQAQKFVNETDTDTDTDDIVQADITEELDQTASIENSVRRKIKSDIVLISVIGVEFDALKQVFDVATQEPDFRVKGTKYYSKVMKFEDRSIKVWLTMIGDARNIPAAMFTRDVYDLFDAEAYILIGIAGGNKKKVKLGDVVASKMVVDLEGGVSKLYPFSWGPFERVQPRIKTYEPPRRILNQVRGISTEGVKEMRRLVQKLVDRTPNEDRSKVQVVDNNFTPSYELAVILSGEKVLRNGKLPKYAKEHHDQLVAVEMEGQGFAASSDHCGIPWMVIRGISDFGDPHKGDNWQYVAALAAASMAKVFLEREFEREDEEPVF
ncbi:MAG: hypothetical protein ACE37D_21280 [Pseudomonadales bacterium]